MPETDAVDVIVESDYISLDMVIVLLTTLSLLGELPSLLLNHKFGDRLNEGDKHRGKAVTFNVLTICVPEVIG